MLNTDIFKFEFVDRVEERQTIDRYLADFTRSPGYALWLKGKRGTGKSFFLTEQVVCRKDFTSVYVNVEIGNNTPGSYLKALITQLNKSADLKFTSYLRANYKSIATIGQKALNLALSLADLDDIGLDELGTSITNFFISKRNEKENSVTVIQKYIAEALKKCERLVFVLDNFSQCDTTSLEVIVSTIHSFINNALIKFIICTTDDDLEARSDIKGALAEKIPNKLMLIQPFEQKLLFARMLEHTFDLDENNIKMLVHVFDLCQGVPQRFKEILINLYTNQGIIVEGNKAQFVMDAFKKVLIKGEMSFDIEALCREQRSAKILLQIIALWGMPISTRVLLKFLEFFSDSSLVVFIKEDVSRTLQILENLHILNHTFEENTALLQFEHDSLKLAVKEYFHDDRSVPFLHFSIYEYLMTLEDELNQPYWHTNYQSLLAYHSFASQAEGWIELNYAYGRTFFDAKLFKEAEAIFSRLDSVVASLSGEQLLTMGITLFYCGQYHKANDLLSTIQSRNMLNIFSVHQLFQLYTFQARARSCILDNKGALEAIENAEHLDMREHRCHIILMGVKQSSLYMTPGCFLEAKQIFDELVKEDVETPEMARIYQSAMDYYEGKESLKYLTKGLDLARHFSDHIIEGKTLNNLGFEHLRCGNYEKAYDCFEESIGIIKEVQPHELVYPYSNLAVLHMISRNWEQALSDIVEALFWNKSDYASLVLKTNRMLCYYFLGNQHWEKIYSELYDYIKSNHCVDDKIYKKICINMALIASKNNITSDAMDLLNLCRPHLETEWPHGKYRFLKLYEAVTGESQKLTPPANIEFIKYYCELEFEPWLVNFSHD